MQTWLIHGEINARPTDRRLINEKFDRKRPIMWQVGAGGIVDELRLNVLPSEDSLLQPKTRLRLSK